VPLGGGQHPLAGLELARQGQITLAHGRLFEPINVQAIIADGNGPATQPGEGVLTGTRYGEAGSNLKLMRGQVSDTNATPAHIRAAPMIRPQPAACCSKPSRPYWSSSTENTTEAVTVSPVKGAAPSFVAA
jgi:hypothetical protein